MSCFSSNSYASILLGKNVFHFTQFYFTQFATIFSFARRLHQQFESYKEQVRKIGEEARRYQGEHKDDAPTCGICHKTKFADGCGHLCSYCRTKFCARCGGRVSLRSNNVSILGAWEKFRMWIPLRTPPKKQQHVRVREQTQA